MRLNENEVKQFMTLHDSLLLYVNQKNGLVKNIKSIGDFKENKERMRNIIELRNYLTENLSIIDDFIAENPFNFSGEKLGIIKKWKGGILNDTFIVAKYDGELTIFYDSEKDKCYGVHSLNNHLKYILGSHLPLFIRAWLLPFGDKIVYDGLIETYRISIGGNMRKSMKMRWEESMMMHGIITSFESENKKSASDEDILRFYMKSQSNRTEYYEEIQKLRRKSSSLEDIYHREQGRNLSRDLRKQLRRISVKGHFAAIDGAIVVSAKTPKELERRISEMVPKEKAEWIFRFKI